MAKSKIPQKVSVSG